MNASLRPQLRRSARLVLPAVLALLAACGGADESAAAPQASPAAAHVTGHVSGVHAVRCGCAIESVGTCGNYVEVDGTFVTLGGDLGLGVMEFCGQEGLKARVEGDVVDGVLVATAYELVD